MKTWLGQFLFISMALVLWGGLHVYLYQRITRTYDSNRRVRLALKIALPVLASLYFLGRVLQARIHHEFGTYVVWPGATYLAILAIGFSLLLPFDLCFTLPSWILRRKHLRLPGERDPIRTASRWYLPLVIITAVVASVYGTVGALRGPAVTRLEVQLADLPPAMDGFRIVQLSDLHVGGLVGHGYLEDVLTTAEPLNADLVVATGDISDERNGGDGSAIARIASLNSRFGVLSVTGNHEFYTGGDTTVEAYRRFGLPVLQQEHVVIADGLVVVGVDDPVFLGGPGRVEEALEKATYNVPAGLPVLLLSHQPLGVEKAATAGVDLMLSGHTHGGQVPPFHLFSKLIYGYLTGYYRVQDLQLYVSNGAGFWGPATRLFADAEIVLITLRPL